MKLLQIEPKSPEWFAYRAPRISGSTAAAILGAPRAFAGAPTALTEWARLTGKVAEEPQTGAHLRWGEIMEEPNRVLYQEATGRIVDPIKCVAQHDRVGWLCYTPDGLVVASEAGARISLPALFEAKAPSPWKADEWSDAIPLWYQIQGQVGMEVLGLEWCSFSALLWPGVRWFDIQRHERFASVLMERLQRFMDYNVARDIPPDASSSERDTAVLSSLARADIEWTMSEEIATRFEEFERLSEEVGEREERLDAIKNRLVQLTGRANWKTAKSEIKRARKVTA